MSSMVPGLMACFLYLGGAGFQLAGLNRNIPHGKTWVYALGIAAIGFHGVGVIGDLVTPEGINMSIYVMGSFTSLVIAMLLIISSLRRPIENLFIGLFPLAAATILFSTFGNNSYAPRSDLTLGIYSHILFSILAYSLLTIAAFQALFLSFQDYELRHKKLTLMKNVPALQTIESMLFELIWTGLIFLSLSIASGFIFLEDIAAQRLIHHTVITLGAWIVFSILLWGRYRLGWRGPVASRWTLGGFVLLLTGYFGSKLVLEILLGA